MDLVSTGREAVERLAQADYDLVFMDCQMPVMDGFEATVAIRASGGKRSTIPIIAMTAYALPSDRERCLEAGMTDYLSKPLEAAQLREVLARLLPQTESPA